MDEFLGVGFASRPIKVFPRSKPGPKTKAKVVFKLSERMARQIANTTNNKRNRSDEHDRDDDEGEEGCSKKKRREKESEETVVLSLEDADGSEVDLPTLMSLMGSTRRRPPKDPSAMLEKGSRRDGSKEEADRKRRRLEKSEDLSPEEKNRKKRIVEMNENVVASEVGVKDDELRRLGSEEKEGEDDFVPMLGDDGRILNNEQRKFDSREWDDFEDFKGEEEVVENEPGKKAATKASPSAQKGKRPYRYDFEKERKKKTSFVTAYRCAFGRKDLEFRLMKTEYSVVPGEGGVIHLYGHTRGHDTADVRIDAHGFAPYFYVKKPSDWNVHDVDSFVEKLEKKVYNTLKFKEEKHGGSALYKSFDKLIVGHSIERCTDIKDFDFYEGIEAIKIVTAYPKLVADVRRKIENAAKRFQDPNTGELGKCFLDDLPRTERFECKTYESDFPYVSRFMCDRRIDGEVWLRVPNAEFKTIDYRKPDLGQDAFLDCPVDLHVSCHYESLRKLTDDEVLDEPMLPEEEDDVVYVDPPESDRKRKLRELREQRESEARRREANGTGRGKGDGKRKRNRKTEGQKSRQKRLRTESRAVEAERRREDEKREEEARKNPPDSRRVCPHPDKKRGGFLFRLEKGVDRSPTGKVVKSYDIEVAGKKGIIPRDGSDPVIDIGITLRSADRFDERTFYCFVLRSCPGSIEHNGRKIRVYSYEDETEMLMDWVRFILTVDPEVLTGYNVDTFDLYYLLKRVEYLMQKAKAKHGQDHVTGLESFSNCTRDPSRPLYCKDSNVHTKGKGTILSYDVSIPGRVQFDMLPFIRNKFCLRSNKLGDVGKHFLKIPKEDMDYEKIPFHFGSRSGRVRLAKYCVHDAFIADELMVNRNALMDVEEEAIANHMTIEDILKRGQTAKCKCNVYNICFGKPGERTLVTTRTEEDRKREQQKYDGAFVFPPRVGFFDDPIFTVDFASLYPSIMMDNNFCVSTKADEHKLIAMGWIEGKDYFKIHSTGKCYVAHHRRKGVFPRILEDLLALRGLAKRKMGVWEAQDSNMKEELEKKVKPKYDEEFKKLTKEAVGGKKWRELMRHCFGDQPGVMGEGFRARLAERAPFINADDLVSGAEYLRTVTLLRQDVEDKINKRTADFQASNSGAQPNGAQKNVLFADYCAMNDGELPMGSRWKALFDGLVARRHTEEELKDALRRVLPLVTIDAILKRNLMLNRLYAVGDDTFLLEHTIAKIKFSNYNSKQNAIKGIMNSMYGALGAAISFLYDPDTAASVTGEGQEMIKNVSDTTMKYFQRSRVFTWGDPGRALGESITDLEKETKEDVVKAYEKRSDEDRQKALIAFEARKAHWEANKHLVGSVLEAYEDKWRFEKELDDRIVDFEDREVYRKEEWTKQGLSPVQIVEETERIKAGWAKELKDWETLNAHRLRKDLFWVSPFDNEVIYGDTDSVFFRQFSPVRMESKFMRDGKVVESMHMGRLVAAFITKKLFGGAFNKFIKLEWEKTWKVLIMYSKKKYCGIMWMFDRDNKVVEKPPKFSGIEVSRRDNCPLVPSTMSTCLKILFEDGIKKGVPKAIDHVKKKILELRTNKISWDELTVSGALKKEIHEYDTPTPFSMLASKMNDRKDDPNFILPGTRMKAVIINHPDSKKKADKVEDPLYAWENKIPLDIAYYLDNLFLPPMCRLFLPVFYPKDFNAEGVKPSEKKDACREIRKKLIGGAHMNTVHRSIDPKGLLAGCTAKVPSCEVCRRVLPDNTGRTMCLVCENNGGRERASTKISRELEEMEVQKILMDETCQACVGNTYYNDTSDCKSDGCPTLWRQKMLDARMEEARDKLLRLSHLVRDW